MSLPTATIALPPRVLQQGLRRCMLLGLLSLVCTCWAGAGDIATALGHCQDTEQARDAVLGEALALLPPAADASADGDRLELALCAAAAAQGLGRLDDAARLLEAAVAGARRHKRDAQLAHALAARGRLYTYRGANDAALADLNEAIGRYQALGNVDSANLTLTVLANLYTNIGEHAQALRYHRELLAQFERQGRKFDQAVALFNIGNVQGNSGQFDDARKSFEQAIALAQSIKDARTVAYAERAIASQWLTQGQAPKAMPHLRRARAFFLADPDPEQGALFRLYHAQALRALGKPAEALAELEPALAVYQRNKSLYYEIWARKDLGYVLADLGRWREAFYQYDRTWHAHLEWDRRTQSEQQARLRANFDAARRESENLRLTQERNAAEQALADAQRLRQWQSAVLGLALLTLGLLGYLIWRQLKRSRHLRALAYNDELTGVSNRRAIFAQGADLLATARAHQQPLALLTFDIDHFKRVNDDFGHATGDRVLRAVATASQQALRRGDRLGRIGGEEFLVVLPAAALAAAAEVARRIVHAVAELPPEAMGMDRRITVSVGVAELAPRDRNIAALLERADAALYRAKEQGRNRVEEDIAAGQDGAQASQA